jgi:RHH-type proline utilization regulon transcriptional repressor/proline dehydrogenase/delta 1-pyrroline-5-carboxylate dehydrogenase
MEGEAETYETPVLALGRELLQCSRARRRGVRRVSWLDELFGSLVKNEAFRVQALRFVDVMPSLTNDASLVRHYQEYFSGEFDMSGPLQWGLRRAGRGLSPRLLAAVVRRSVLALGGNFLAGETLQQVMRVADGLANQHIAVSLDRLGEATTSDVEAEAYLAQYLDAVNAAGERLAELSVPPGHFNLSIKLSGLDSQIAAVAIDRSVGAISERLRPLIREAVRRGVSLTFDMEQYDHKPIVLAVFRRLLGEPEFRDWPGAGIAIQAYLRDAESDLRRLIHWVGERGAPVTVRLVRGAYWDEETVLAQQQGWATPVWREKSDTDRCFERCLGMLFRAQPRIRLAVATHNVYSIASAMQRFDTCRSAVGEFEFQMLYGMAEGLRTCVVERGYPMRLYLPFGELLPGMAYLVRRLLENSSSQSMLRMLDMDEEKPGNGNDGRSPVPEAQAGKGLEPVAVFRNEPLRRFVSADEWDAWRTGLETVRGELGETYPLSGSGNAPDATEWIVSLDPAWPERVVGRVAAARIPDADLAVGRARMAFSAWAARPMSERIELLRRIAAELRRRRDEFAAWQVCEAGKSWVEADADVAEAIDFLEFYAVDAERLGQTRVRDAPGETNRLHYRALGVGVVLPPWNFPLAIPVGMIAASLVTGNAVVFKPSSLTPVIACRFVRLCKEVGIPEGVLNLLPGRGSIIGEYLVRHPDIAFVAFTGSREVGLRINHLAADPVPGSNHVKRIIAEMGGKNAVIVDEDADLDEAVKGVIQSAFGYQGQKCSACSRVIVVGDAYDRFLMRLVNAMNSLRIGDPADPGHFMGPVIDAAAKQKIEEWIERGARVASRVFHGPQLTQASGYYVSPVILDEVPVDAEVAQEEIFGPVLSLMRANDFEQALQLANGVRYALTGGLYSRSPVNIRRAVDGFEVGNLYINRKITRAMVDRQPFGGFKLSGMGNKTGGPDYLLQFVHARNVTENTLRRGFAPS